MSNVSCWFVAVCPMGVQRADKNVRAPYGNRTRLLESGVFLPKMKEESGWHGVCYKVCAMKNRTDITKKACVARKAVVSAANSEQGSMMLEYVIVLCGIGAALALFMNRQFFDYAHGFGPLGQGIVAFYQRTLGGLSLPVP